MQDTLLTGAENLLTATDVTVAGVLLASIAILMYYNNKKEKRIESLNGYIRTQDKETLKVLLELTNTLKVNHETSKEVKQSVDSIDHIVNNNNGALSSLSLLIQNKLIHMK